MVENSYDISWMDEKIDEYPKFNGLYRLFCLMLFKKRMTYSNLYVLSYALNKNKYKDNELTLKELIIKDLAAIYYFNNKKLPNGFKFKTE